MTVTDLAEGLGMDRSNLKKLVKKLRIKPERIRGKRNQWTSGFTSSQIETLLVCREGCKNTLKKNKEGEYYVG